MHGGDVYVLRREPRANRDRRVLADKTDRLYDPPVGPLNRFVDQLRRERADDSVPYVDPDSGGNEALILALFQDPGPKTRAGTGSGMLSWANDDPSAACFCRLLAKTGLDWKLLVPWNAVPWQTGGKNTAAVLAQGRRSLRDFLELLPNAVAVLLAGDTATAQWRLFAAEYAPARQLRAFRTLHPGGRGLTRGSRQTQAQGIAAMEAHLASLSAYVRGT